MAKFHVKLWSARRWLVAPTLVVVMVLLALALVPAQAQRLDPADCLKPGEPLLRMPELASSPANRKLNATIVLADELRRLTDTTVSLTDCAQVYLRYFYGVNATPAPVPPGTPVPPPSKYKDPMPGPTLRARVGDLVQLTFLNHVNPLNYPGSLDQGDSKNACDQFSGGYPFSDTFPNCFHGSSTANIHFHGTHTNPNSTGDNVYLGIRPSPIVNGQPIIDARSVAGPFGQFYKDCEANLAKDVLSQWPYKYGDVPTSWTGPQKDLILRFDNGQSPYAPPARPKPNQLWPVNQEAIDHGQWPQYWIGAYPYCFRLPQYTQPVFPPPGPGLRMGQAPGTHWYHAHKHGSTALNVSNGMTGAFVIEGGYDDELNAFYGQVGSFPWTRVQPVLVLNQLGQTPNLARGTFGAQAVAVNGRVQPQHTMRPGEVQLWRIVNTSSQSAVFLVGPPKADPQKSGVDPTVDFEWMQLAQDGVQFADPNYKKSRNISLMIASGNRADFLVKAPPKPITTPYQVMVQPTVSAANLSSTTPVVLMSVLVSGTPPENPRQRQFIPRAPRQPPFLADITDEEVKWSDKKTLTFNSKNPGTPVQHTINNMQFSEDPDHRVVVWLNKVEEWKIENSTLKLPAGFIDHPFHIHVNPFQITEVFDPNAKVVDPTSGQTLPKYVTDTPTVPSLQCQLNLSDKTTWRDCHNKPEPYGIWWDTFAIPAGATFTSGNTVALVPGYFKMRSRFVDYAGYYVLHCHILAHEDRGMMLMVEVRPLLKAPLQHH